MFYNSCKHRNWHVYHLLNLKKKLCLLFIFIFWHHNLQIRIFLAFSVVSSIWGDRHSQRSYNSALQMYSVNSGSKAVLRIRMFPPCVFYPRNEMRVLSVSIKRSLQPLPKCSVWAKSTQLKRKIKISKDQHATKIIRFKTIKTFNKILNIRIKLFFL